LLLRLIDAGASALEDRLERSVRERRAAIAATSGKYADVFADDYLKELRRDWPE
jgi:chloramphenicol 3-O-phosphotransferase